MARVCVLGGTGYAGAAIVAEAARRGHEVTAVSRKPPAEPVPGVTYLTGSVLQETFLEQAVDGQHVVIEALSPRGDMAGKVERVFDRLLALAERDGFRFGVVGGVSSMLVAPDGPRLLEASPPSPEVRAEAELGVRKLEVLRETPESVDWFYVSPAAEFGAWVPGEKTGTYRVSDDVLLTGPDGRSHISAADLALAVLDEIEQPGHRRRRFHVAN